MNIRNKSYTLHEGVRGGNYIIKNNKKIYQQNISGGSLFIKAKLYNLSIQSEVMKGPIELICDICKNKEWNVAPVIVSKSRFGTFIPCASFIFDRKVRLCACTTCGNIRYFKNQSDLIKTRVHKNNKNKQVKNNKNKQVKNNKNKQVKNNKNI
jgi:hypothetical protein